MLGSLRGGLSVALEPPHQSWLALLGLSSLAIKNTGSAWRTLINEGADVEAQLARQITGAAQRVGLPFVTRGKTAQAPEPTES
jgi:hypothetical protein